VYIVCSRCIAAALLLLVPLLLSVCPPAATFAARLHVSHICFSHGCLSSVALFLQGWVTPATKKKREAEAANATLQVREVGRQPACCCAPQLGRQLELAQCEQCSRRARGSCGLPGCCRCLASWHGPGHVMWMCNARFSVACREMCGQCHRADMRWPVPQVTGAVGVAAVFLPSHARLLLDCISSCRRSRVRWAGARRAFGTRRTRCSWT